MRNCVLSNRKQNIWATQARSDSELSFSFGSLWSSKLPWFFRCWWLQRLSTLRPPDVRSAPAFHSAKTSVTFQISFARSDHPIFLKLVIKCFSVQFRRSSKLICAVVIQHFCCYHVDIINLSKETKFLDKNAELSFRRKEKGKNFAVQKLF